MELPNYFKIRERASTCRAVATVTRHEIDMRTILSVSTVIRDVVIRIASAFA